MTKLIRVQHVELNDGFNVTVKFTDGSYKQINLEPYLRGPIFESIRNNTSEFRAMFVEEGTVA